ncbi:MULTISPECIES: hypothetical protein [unclassified Caballeronia]|uniref:hypothetical protein n=1 Tax=unclassified Caballeronia TaxID=2646786 RepID=UPI002854D4C6|nr:MULTISPECIES: hypothetical protein [unclassified Caballeronia]MDR5740305.1 hypothetical protein [Caballeronia sp. LZ016]MDR5808515.1 hypothetical protein [Caballeronia sp. LZ019]
MQGIGNYAVTRAIVALIFIAATIVIAVAYYSVKHGLRETVKRTLLAILLLVVATIVINYSLEARTRARIVTAKCAKSVSPTSRYVARTCYSGGRVVLRVLTADESSLLAERTFWSYGDDPARLYWEDGRLKYGDGDENGVHFSSITLPPNLKDRLLAHLP